MTETGVGNFIGSCRVAELDAEDFARPASRVKFEEQDPSCSEVAPASCVRWLQGKRCSLSQSSGPAGRLRGSRCVLPAGLIKAETNLVHRVFDLQTIQQLWCPIKTVRNGYLPEMPRQR